MKHRTHKLAAKTVAAILCAALMLTACGSKETTSNETAVTETTSVESTEITTTEAAVAEPTVKPTVEPTVEPTEAPTEVAPTETTPAESPAPAVEPTAVSTGYTYSELNQTMYAKSAVNVRDLPSTDGKKIGSLKASQEITVTGKCDQTGWYRFELNNTIGYVSDKYIVSEKPAANTIANTGSSNAAAQGNTTQQNTAAPAATPVPAQTTATGSSEPYFDRAIAEQVFALVNEERVANGIPALIWSEDVYNIAVQRCYEGAAGDIHGMMRNGTSENRTEGQMGDGGAQEIYQSWYNSPGHHNNYLNASYTSSAVAVYAQPCPIEGLGGPQTVVYQVFTWDNTAANSSVTINTPVQDDSVAAAPKTADENTGTSSSNVGWSLTPPTQEDGLKKWQEQNPDVEVSFGN